MIVTIIIFVLLYLFRHIVVYKPQVVPSDDEIELMKIEFNILKRDPTIGETQIYDVILNR